MTRPAGDPRPSTARVRCALLVEDATGGALYQVTDDQVWAADRIADPAWLRVADVITSGGDAAAVVEDYPACRIVVVRRPLGGVAVTVVERARRAGNRVPTDPDGVVRIPARSGWDARLLGAIAHTWVSSGQDPVDLAGAWPTRRLTRLAVAAARRSADVSLRLGERRVRCRWTMRC